MENDVKLVSYKGYYHLLREVNGVHYLGFSDHRIGLSVRTIDESEIQFRDRPFRIEKMYSDQSGKLVDYIDEPYTESQIETFGNLTEEELIQWSLRGT